MPLENLHDLFQEKLKDMYSAENQIIKALPGMIKNASTPELKQALQEHLDVTEAQARRIEQITSMIDSSPRGKKCVGMEGVLEEGKELLKEKADPEVLDAGIIAAAQSVEHYEIAGYGTARAWAKRLGYPQAADLLEQTLEEERQADETLTALAERQINAMAQQGSGQMSMAGNGKKQR